MKKRTIFISLLIFIIIILAAVIYRCSVKPIIPDQPLTVKPVDFSQLPGWKTTPIRKSFTTFQASCRVLLRQNQDNFIGNASLNLRVKDWHSSCEAALNLKDVNEESARTFFQTWFIPVGFYQDKPVRGLFTGYYMPLLHGSLVKTTKYNVPIYGMPSDLVTANLSQFYLNLRHKKIVGRLKGDTLLPYYTRAEINEGAIDKVAPVLVWIDDPVDRVFLEIQGSGIVRLPNGEELYLGYAGQNGAPYTSIAKVLIDKGIMTKDNASMQAIKHYLNDHPEDIDKVLNKNKSFVFFNLLPQNAALGTQGIALTPGYSLAVDRHWVPLGAPLWLSTTRPHHTKGEQTFQRLMIAQDTGGAIRGSVRGDVFWGAGTNATYIAGHMKNEGYYWLLLPQHTVKGLNKPLLKQN